MQKLLDLNNNEKGSNPCFVEKQMSILKCSVIGKAQFFKSQNSSTCRCLPLCMEETTLSNLPSHYITVTQFKYILITFIAQRFATK